MPNMRGLLLPGLSAVLFLVAALAPAQAADALITVTPPTAIALPAAQAPAGYLLQPQRSQVITDATLLPIMGRYMLATFHQNGWLTGYHGWLDAPASPGAPFVTYDIFGFKAVKGARLARLSYQNLVPGAPATVTDPSLPKSATIWTDTGSFGAASQSYTVAEIVFRVANVVGDVTGYYAGGDQTATDASLQQATAVTVAYVHWLSTLLSSPKHSLLLPYLPLVAVLPRVPRLTRRS